MADGLNLASLSGTCVTDDCGAPGHAQVVKLAIATDGSATLIPADATDGMLVNLGGNNDVTVTSGTVTLGAGTAAFGKLAANSGVDIGDVDVTSLVPGTGATSLGKAVDSAAGGTDTGVAILAVRDDALAALTPIEGDYVPARVDANGALWVIPSGTVTIAGAVTQSGTWNVTNISGTISLPTGAATAAKQPALGTAGTASADVISVQGIASMTALKVDGSAVTQPVSGTVTANLSATDNAVLDTIDTSTAAAATSLAILDDWDNAASDGASVSGDVAHDTADAGEPVKIGAKATSSLSALTPVNATADRTNLFAGMDGVLITRPHCNLEDIVTSGLKSNTDGASTELLAAGAAGIKHYLTTLTFTNTSATNIYVEIKDNTTTRLVVPVPATGGAVVNLPVPLPGTAATAWNFDGSAAATTLYVSAVGFKSKV